MAISTDRATNPAKEFAQNCADIRRDILKVAHDCGQPTHLGGALSMVEVLNFLFSHVLSHDPAKPDWNGRDIFILSKGHCVLGYLVTLYHQGYFGQNTLASFQSNGSEFIAHPIKNIDYGIESSNGSLGQGLSYGLGLAVGYKKLGLQNKVFVMMGDGECNEGMVWEAAALAAELELDNLIAVVDDNGLRNDGKNTTFSMDARLQKIWNAFGWKSVEVDGHDVSKLEAVFNEFSKISTQPKVMIAKTTKGKGISFMEDNNDWHHNRVTASIYEKCLEELQQI